MPLYFVLAAVLVAIDQGVKYFVRESIPLHTAVDFLPGLDLTYVQNTGAAFSLFSQHTWILALLSVVVSVVSLPPQAVRDRAMHRASSKVTNLLIFVTFPKN